MARKNKGDLDFDVKGSQRARLACGAKPFNGVVGTPPDWFPQQLSAQFIVARSKLLQDYSEDKIVEWINELEALKKAAVQEVIAESPPMAFRPNFPVTMWADLETLNYARYIFNLGELKGIEAFLSESTAKIYRGQMAKAAAQAPRTDALQEIIISVAEKNIDISVLNLTDKLRAMAGVGTIQDIEEQTIYWTDKNGNTQTSPISGLKDRLTRARKKINSR